MMGLSTISKNSADNKRPVSMNKLGLFFSPVIQPKLTINQPNDIYEQEADAVADRIMRMGDHHKEQSKFFSPSASTLQLKCAHCEKEEKEKKVQRNESSPETPPVTETYVHSLQGGNPLPSTERNFFESRMGYDFSDIRIHTDNSANISARNLNALAFTHRNNIVFGAGQYQPGTEVGRRLLAHELTHTVQQGSIMRKAQNPTIEIQKKCSTCADKEKLQLKESSACSAVVEVKDKSTLINSTSNDIVMRLCGDSNCGATDPATPPCPESSIFFTHPTFNLIRESIFVSTSHPVKLRRGDVGNAIVLVQQFLLNFLCSGINRDGIRREIADSQYGRFTAQAVRVFQSGHSDANGLPLVVDGEVGPATLNAMDISMGLPPVNVPLAPEGRGECFGRSEHGPGVNIELDLQRGQLPLMPPFIPAMRAWELLNFDIDQRFVKTEHRNFLRSDIIPAFNAARAAAPSSNVQVKIIGEASTTASDRHNQTLSENRTHCVVSSLIGLGIPSGAIIHRSGMGEQLARARRIARGEPVIDEVEDRTERKVTVVLYSPAVNDQDCDKTKPSRHFVMKIACQNPHTFFINVGDISDLSQPTYREFTWLLDGSLTGCTYALNVSPSVLLPINVSNDLHLAISNPDDFYAPSEFRGAVNLQSQIRGATLLKDSILGQLYNVFLSGSWSNIGCRIRFRNLPGIIIPRGPAHCGFVPDPPRSTNCEEITRPCSESERRQEATRFEGRLVRLTGDPLEILRRIPGTRNVMRVVDEILNRFGRQVLAGGAFITLASTNLPVNIRRNFIFMGAGLTVPSSSFIEASLVWADEFTLPDPKKLETDTASLLSHGSDFEGHATLTIKGQSNHTEIAVSGNGINRTIVFKGLFCNSGSDRVASGRLVPATETECDTLFVPWMPERDCGEEGEDCPTSRKTESGQHFQFKIGRATYSSLPLASRKIADSVGGCGATMAFINIGRVGTNPIHRKFLLIARNTSCAYQVDRGNSTQYFLVPRFLSFMDGEDPLDPSHFMGPASLSSTGSLHITNIPSTDILLPGHFIPNAAACPGAHADGMMIPVSAVDCGEAPEPLHLTTPDPTDIDRCAQFRDNNPFVQSEITALNRGLYDEIIDMITNPPALRYPRYKELFSMIGLRVNNAVFPGKAADGTPVITIIDFRVLNVRRDSVAGYLFQVQILSDPCTYTATGQPVFLRERGCREGFIINGQNSLIFPIIPRMTTDNPATPERSAGNAVEDREVPEVRGPGGIMR